jgi:hypothetical protein
MPAKKSKTRRSVSDQISDAAARVVDGDDYQQFQAWNHGRTDRVEFEVIERVEISEGTGTLFDVVESNLDDGTKTPRPKPKVPAAATPGKKKPREIGLDALGEWTDKQPWYIWAPMMQFVVVPLYVLRLLFWFVLFGFVLYFMSGGGAP